MPARGKAFVTSPTNPSLGEIQSDYYQVRIAVMDAINANDAAIINKDVATIGDSVDHATNLSLSCTLSAKMFLEEWAR